MSNTGLNILVIDDNLDFSEMLADTLAAVGHRCVVAISGEAGVQRAEEQHFDLALVDVMLPGMSGIEVAGRLLGREPSVPVVLITGYTEEAILRSAPEGVTTVLTKPVSLEVILGIIERVGGARRATGSSS
jgi:CheY-like chemotaxis protein